MNEPRVLGPTDWVRRPDTATALACLGPDPVPRSVEELRQGVWGAGIRITSTRQEQTIVYATFLDGAKPVNAVALPGHSFSAAGTVRAFALDEDTQPNEVAKLEFPSSIQASTNLTGTVANVQQDPRATDANRLTATNPALDIDLRLRFGAPVSGFEWMTGTAGQLLLVRVERTSAAGTPTLAPWLFEGGTQIRQLATALAITAETLWTLEFDAAELSSLTSSTIELRLIATAQGGASINVLSAAHVGYQVKTTSTVLADTGWLAVPSTLGSSDPWNGADANRLPPAQHLLLSFAATVLARQVVVAVRDQGNAAGYIEWRAMPIGPAFIGPFGMSPGPLFDVVQPPGIEFTAGGMPFGSRLRPRRKLPVRLQSLSPAAAAALWLRVPWANGPSEPVVIALFPDDAELGAATTLWGYPGADLEPFEVRQELRPEGGLPVVFDWQFWVTEV